MSNSLSAVHPELIVEWSKKNEIKPTEATVGSHKKVIWKCRLGHEWTASVKSRSINGSGCPYRDNDDSDAVQLTAFIKGYIQSVDENLNKIIRFLDSATLSYANEKRMREKNSYGLLTHVLIRMIIRTWQVTIL